MTRKDSSNRSTQRNQRQITSKSRIDNLKKEAKRWLKALEENDPESRARFEQILSIPLDHPTLRQVQYALAREHGFESWAALKNALDAQTEAAQEATRDNIAELANLFLENASADPILANGPAAHERRGLTALRILNRHPEIARYNLHTAVVCGELQEVERILSKSPELVSEPGGPLRKRQRKELEKLWTPLLHLCYGRLPIPAAADNSLAIATMLLDHGADPNEYFEVGSYPCRYTTLCGVAGEGEDNGPPHPRKEEIARLLLERGANPYDIQVIYNIHFNGKVLWFLKLMYEFSLKAGKREDWNDPEWSMIGMGGYGSGARWHLAIAVRNNDLELAEWVLSHGATPNVDITNDHSFSQPRFYDEAVKRGLTEMADLLLRHGAIPSGPVEIDGLEAFTAACLRSDKHEVLSTLRNHPEYLLSHVPIFAAARKNRVDVVEFLLDLGVSIEVEDQTKQRPLHEAASHDSLEVAKLLIERGAEIEPVETNWNNTPLDHAMYGNITRMIDFLSGFTRNVYYLTWLGKTARLREILSEDPQLATKAGENNTPLMWLPEDETQAKEIIELLVANGADPTVKNGDGLTAADCAEQRGLYEAAALLRSL